MKWLLDIIDNFQIICRMLLLIPFFLSREVQYLVFEQYARNQRGRSSGPASPQDPWCREIIRWSMLFEDNCVCVNFFLTKWNNRALDSGCYCSSHVLSNRSVCELIGHSLTCISLVVALLHWLLQQQIVLKQWHFYIQNK